MFATPRRKYGTLYERLVANTVLAVPDNASSCWLWTGPVDARGYPRIAVRVEPRPASPKQLRAHRLMLEEMHDCFFPFDEGGHLCYNTVCINPMHLEIQTTAFNSSDRRGYAPTGGCFIPTLFPRSEQWARIEAILDELF